METAGTRKGRCGEGGARTPKSTAAAAASESPPTAFTLQPFHCNLLFESLQTCHCHCHLQYLLHPNSNEYEILERRLIPFENLPYETPSTLHPSLAAHRWRETGCNFCSASDQSLTKKSSTSEPHSPSIISTHLRTRRDPHNPSFCLLKQIDKISHVSRP